MHSAYESAKFAYFCLDECLLLWRNVARQKVIQWLTCFQVQYVLFKFQIKILETPRKFHSEDLKIENHVVDSGKEGPVVL